MRITVIGATGMVGTSLVAEAVARGHRVVAGARRPTPPADGVTPATVDAAAPRTLPPVLDSADAVLLTLRPAPTGGDDSHDPLTAAVLDAATGRAPVLVIGGAGPLRVPGSGGALVIDDPTYVAPEWRAIAAASSAQLRTCERHANTDWAYLSPPADLRPGHRTGRYRRGTTTLLTDADGRSHISVQDLAVAALDELETPAGVGHFTVAHRDAAQPQDRSPTARATPDAAPANTGAPG